MNRICAMFLTWCTSRITRNSSEDVQFVKNCPATNEYLNVLSLILHILETGDNNTSVVTKISNTINEMLQSRMTTAFNDKKYLEYQDENE